MPKKKLLFITPVIPSATGNGLAMRAYHFMEVLSEAYDIYALIVRLRPEKGNSPGQLPFCRGVSCARVRHRRHAGILLRHLCHKISPRLFMLLFQTPTEAVYVTPGRINRAAAPFLGIPFDLIHVFRLYMAPFARPFLARHPEVPCRIDVDDIESRTRARIIRLHRENQAPWASATAALEASIYARLESREFPRAEALFVCSETDRRILKQAYPSANIRVAPNVVEIPPPPSPGPATSPFSFLFVGTLGYPPNADALRYFCDQVLPRLKAMAPFPFTLRVAGSGMPPALLRALPPEVDYLGFVEDLTPLYARSDAVIVPVRTGGGTRIKVLEAFAHGKAVVSTSLGVEGLDVSHGETALIADTPEAFAENCLKVMTDGPLKAGLAEKGYRLAAVEYSPAALHAALFSPDMA